MKPRIAASNLVADRVVLPVFIHPERFPRGARTNRPIYGNVSPVSEQTFGAAFTQLRPLLKGAGKP